MIGSEGESSTQSPVVLSLKNVSHSFAARKENFNEGEHHVLKNVNFDLYKGQVVGVVGKNGVGKTTLLRLMAGILAPKSGDIEIYGGAGCALLSLGLGFLPQLSGRDNAKLSSMLQGSSATDADETIERVAAFAELGHSFDEPVKTYSAGMRARLGFATSLFTKVDILLIDEVLAVGDAEFRKKARSALLEKIAGEQTVMIVSHSERQIKSLCNRAILIENGSLVSDGSPTEVFDRYAT